MGSLYDKAKGLQPAPVSSGGSLYERATAAPTIAPTVAPVAPQKAILAKPALVPDAVTPDVTTMDVVKGLPQATLDVGNAFATTFVPAITNFFKTTGGILGEGLAYAVDNNVREQYKAGNLDILPTITDTTQAKLAKATIAAGIETAVYRNIPKAISGTIAQRGGIGALQGVGFAISEGLAKDKTPEEVIDSLPEYGVSGAVIGVVAPYLLPLLKAEVKLVPAGLKKLLSGADEEVKRLFIEGKDEATRIPISTPNTRYEAYLKSQGYEPYVSGEQLPVIDAGGRPAKEPVIDFGKESIPATPKEVTDLSPTWFRGIDEKNTTPESGDIFMSASEEVAGDYGKVVKITPDALPKKPLIVNSKEDLVDQIGYKGDPFVEKKLPIAKRFDTLAKEYASQNGYDAIVYREGSLGEPEIHVFAKQPSTTRIVENAPIPDNTRLVPVKPPKVQAPEPTPQVFDETRTTKVPRESLPVETSQGTTRASGLEARMKNTLDNVPEEKAEAAGITTYKQMNKAEQISAAAKYVDESPEDALAVLKGEKEAPKGLLHNSIALALEKKAETVADANLAIKLASLRSTRFGQEISILTEADPSNPVSHIREIIEARAQRAGRKVRDTVKETAKITTEGKQVLTKSQLQIAEAESLLDAITC